jgi:hypothetical protein
LIINWINTFYEAFKCDAALLFSSGVEGLPTDGTDIHKKNRPETDKFDAGKR